MAIIGAFWVLFACAAVLPMRWSVYLFFASIPFGATTVLPGSANMLPSAPCALLLAAKVLYRAWPRHGSTILDAVLNWRRFGLLTAFLLLCAVLTVVGPYLFRGVTVVGLNGPMETPLVPRPTNLTQYVYLAISYVTVIAAFVMMLEPPGRRLMAQGLLVAALVQGAAGAASMVPGLSGVLGVIRNASYTVFADTEVSDVGMRRVIGLYSEASGFGPAALSIGAMLLLVAPARLLGPFWAFIEALLGVAMVGFTVLSTSSAAYIGLPVLAGAVGSVIVSRASGAAGAAASRSHRWLLVLLVAVGSTAVVAMLWHPELVARAWKLVNVMVFEKRSSDSYAERSTWNRRSLQALVDTGGLGVGVGSTRTSSWLLALLSGSGIAGTLLLGAFILRLLAACSVVPGTLYADMTRSTRLAWLAMMPSALVTGFSLDFGCYLAVLYGMMGALAMPERALPPPRRMPTHDFGARGREGRARIGVAHAAPLRTWPKASRAGDDAPAFRA